MKLYHHPTNSDRPRNR